MRANTRTSFSATIANGASLSGAIDILSTTLLGIQMPAAWTAASLTFQGSADGSTYVDVYNDSNDEYTLPTSTSRLIMLDQTANRFAAMRYLKVRSGTTGSPVTQGADRVITLICGAVNK